MRVKVWRTSVNYADLMARDGGYAAGAPLPFIPGLDALGVVSGVGDGVGAALEGQRVACFPVGGSYAEEIIAPAQLCFQTADDVPQDAAASLTTLVTAYNIVNKVARLQPGEVVLIHAAAGGVGHLAVQFARQAGAQVIAVVGHAERMAFAQQIGAAQVINRHEADFSGQVMDFTAGRGADVILDSIGGQTTEQGLTCLAPFGRLVIYGHASGQSAQLPTQVLHRHSRSVLGYSSGHHRQARPEVIQRAAQAALALAATGHIKVHVGATFPLASAAQAHALLEAGQVNGRIMLLA